VSGLHATGFARSLLKQWVQWAPDLWHYWRRWGAESCLRRVRPSRQNTSCRDCLLRSRGETVPQFCNTGSSCLIKQLDAV